MKQTRFVGIPFLLFATASIAVMGLAISSLWNLLIVELFGLSRISFWQALGLLLLSRLLFGRFPRLDKTRFVRGLKDLTPEERERFRRAMEGQSLGE